MENKFERKGVLTFLATTFAITYALEGGLILTGFRFSAIPGPFGQYVVLIAMWVPAVAVLLTVKLITHEKPALPNLHLGSWKPYVGSALIMPLCFAITYGLTWLFGLTQPDWGLVQFRQMFLDAGVPFPPIPDPMLPIAGLLFASLVTGPFVNGLIAMGEEIGWRGYLLPRLMPLGKVRAYLISGVIWGLWHMPVILIGFTYLNQPILGTLAFILVTTGLGIYINELTLRYNSVWLAGWVHGIFNSQKLGVWALLFPVANPLLGGYAGVIGIIVLFALGIWQLWQGRAEPVANSMASYASAGTQARR